MKKLLITRESECIQPLRALIEEQNHRVLVAWVLGSAGRILDVFEQQVQNDPRPRQALEAAKAWATGQIKMPLAKMAAHSAHNAATQAEFAPAAQAAARAMGHVVGTVHVETHAIGVAMYGVTALLYQGGATGAEAEKQIEEECHWFYQQLLYWIENTETYYTHWADFLLRKGVPNKEKLLHQKEEERNIHPVLYPISQGRGKL